MSEIIERPFELKCPNCKKWTNIHCTDEELCLKALNRTCPHCEKALNWYLPSSGFGEDGVYVMKLAHSVYYRRTVIL